jgi:very-short-patch-repair endonuclease
VLGRAGDRLVRVDFRFPNTPVVVEVMGYRYHRTKQQLARDAERMNALVEQGMRPYQFTYEQVMGDTSRMIDTIAAAVTRLAS